MSEPIDYEALITWAEAIGTETGEQVVRALR